MAWFQTVVRLPPQRRGIHLLTGELCRGLPLAEYRIGLAHFFIQHTSASLAINENADPDVRGDLRRWLDAQVRENEPYYRHTCEGPDDMPAHIKTMLLGESLSIPITDGRLALGTWQGVYLCEHRDHAASRRVMVTLQGE